LKFDEVLTETKMHSFLRHGVETKSHSLGCILWFLCSKGWHSWLRTSTTVLW